MRKLLKARVAAERIEHWIEPEHAGDSGTFSANDQSDRPIGDLEEWKDLCGHLNYQPATTAYATATL